MDSRTVRRHLMSNKVRYPGLARFPFLLIFVGFVCAGCPGTTTLNELMAANNQTPPAPPVDEEIDDSPPPPPPGDHDDDGDPPPPPPGDHDGNGDPPPPPPGDHDDDGDPPPPPPGDHDGDPPAPGSYVVVDTGQGICYGNHDPIAPPAPGQPFDGQDAQYDGVQPSYTDNGDGTVTDLNTGLIWQQTPDTRHFTVEEAREYAENLVLAGHDDWRVPTIKELYSLMDFRGNIHTHTPYIDTAYFDFYYPDPAEGYRDIDAQYWSRNVYVGLTMNGDTSAFGVNFADGRIKAYPIKHGGMGDPPPPPRLASWARQTPPDDGQAGPPVKKNYLRCVRGGEGYGRNLFIDNGDQTITDEATGLMWTATDSGHPMNWQDALAYAENLEHAGHSDWRLPNAKELQSIVDYHRAPDARRPEMRMAALDPIFGLTEEESWFWTGTTHNDNLGGVYICFGRALAHDPFTGEPTVNAHGAGAQRSDPKAGNPADYPHGLGPQGDQIRIYNYVRCVRDAE